MKTSLLFFIVFPALACYSQQVVDTLPDLRKIQTVKVIAYQVKPDVEGAFNMATGGVYETMVVSKKDLSVKAMRKFTKLIYKKSSFEVISSHALVQASSAKMCSTQKESTTNAMESATLSSTSTTNNELDSSSKESSALAPIGLNLADLASGGVSNRYTHILSIEGERYVSVSLCFNTLEKSVRVYAYVKPENIQQYVGPGNPYIVSGKLTEKSAAKIAKLL